MRRKANIDDLDLNLLRTLDVLLSEGSVTGAARRLGLSPSAMSRTLARLRSATSDPLLVRAGRGLVPTPHATRIRHRVHELAKEVRAVLSPDFNDLDILSRVSTYTIRANEGFVELFGARLIEAITRAAPHVCMRFAAKPNKDPLPLREGRIDLEIGLIGSSSHELHSHLLYYDRFVGVSRSGHPLLSEAPVTPERYAACDHVVVSRKDTFHGPVDTALDKLGLKRTVRAVVPEFPNAIQIARQSDLVALVPRSSLGHPQRRGLLVFDLPIPTPEIAVLAMWHPRVDSDLAHQCLRNVVIKTCQTRFETHDATADVPFTAHATTPKLQQNAISD